MKHVFARRLGVLALGSTLALGGVLAPAAQAKPARTSVAGSFWLERQLPATNVFPSTFDPATPDVGLTIDTGLAAVSARDTSLIERTVNGVSQNAAGYVAFGAAATAKTLTFATAVRANPRFFAGMDLVAKTEALIAPNGRLTDPDFPEFDSALGQSFAVRGLTAAGSPKASLATAYLTSLQCANGAFGFDLPAPGAAPTCTETSPTPGADTTALVTVNLTQTGFAANRPFADRAGDFLVGIEQNGAWGGGSGINAPNANSTGLAVAALGAVCQVPAAERGINWLTARQVPNAATGALTAQDGAVALDPAAYAAAQRDGITPELRDQFVRSTSQAVPGLTWVSPYQAPRSLKTKRVAVGGKVKATVSCLRPGTKVVAKLRGVKVETTRVGPRGVATVTFRIKGKAAKAAQVAKIADGGLRKVNLKLKPEDRRPLKKTLRITR